MHLKVNDGQSKLPCDTLGGEEGAVCQVRTVGEQSSWERMRCNNMRLQKLVASNTELCYSKTWTPLL